MVSTPDRCVAPILEVIDSLDVAAASGHACRADAHAESSPAAASLEGEIFQIAARAESFSGVIIFQFESAGPGDPRLVAAKRNEFKNDLCREIVRLLSWAADANWPTPSLPKLQVAVSDQFEISRSLAPAWSGYAGQMEFPLWRVAARRAAIVHELVHVLFPNGNRFLAEGLAVYLQAVIGGNPAFPNFGMPLHENVRELISEMLPAGSPRDGPRLEHINLAELDAIATARPLTMRVRDRAYGEEPKGQAFIYPMAGSFVQFLIEARGMEKFRALYAQTPLVPLAHYAGSPARWLETYGVPFAEIEDEWKSMITAGFLQSAQDDGSKTTTGLSSIATAGKEDANA